MGPFKRPAGRKPPVLVLHRKQWLSGKPFVPGKYQSLPFQDGDQLLVTLAPQVACAKPQLFVAILQIQTEPQFTLLQCEVLGASDQSLTDELVEMEHTKTSQSCVRLFHLCPRHPCATPDLEFAFHPVEFISVGELVPRWAFSVQQMLSPGKVAGQVVLGGVQSPAAMDPRMH